MKTVVANITTWEGQDLDAEHYYCDYAIVDKPIETFTIYGYGFRGQELTRKLSEVEATKLSIKDGFKWHTDDDTNRFNSFRQIHDTLIERFKEYDIITYFSGRPYKSMLYIQDGMNKGVSALGDIWVEVPRTFYADLVDLSKVRVRCERCQKELEDISDLFVLEKCIGRDLYRTYPDESDCCSKPDLMWNVLLY